MNAFLEGLTPAGRAARWVPANPRPLCRDFTSKPEPSDFWCVTCGWNDPMHGDEVIREAIALELARIPFSCPAP